MRLSTILVRRVPNHYLGNLMLTITALRVVGIVAELELRRSWNVSHCCLFVGLPAIGPRVFA